MMVSRRTQLPNEQTHVSEGLIDALMEIGQKRAEILEAMKQALLRGDDGEALERARELTGLPSKNAVAL
jgi:hypothetical protein